MLREPSTQTRVAGAACGHRIVLADGRPVLPAAGREVPVMASAAGRPPEQLSGRAKDAFRLGAPERGAR